MKKVTKRRLEALVLAVTLGVTSVTGYEKLIGKSKVYAENTEPEKIVFAQGVGTGKEFSQDSWQFYSHRIVDNNADTAGPIQFEPGKPGIVENDYTAEEGDKVIRLINGVRCKKENGNASYNEDPMDYNGDKFDYYRVGKATLNSNNEQGIALKDNKEFSMKFTFSMPEAVVNTEQTKGKDDPSGEPYAREVGGDGICFAMTTKRTQELGTGSGIGYQGMEQSFAIELDSFFNGAYIDTNPGENGLANYNFDNQAVGMTDDKNGDEKYHNYVNKNHNERYDHIAVIANGDTRNHLGIYYMDGKTTKDDLRAENKRDGSGNIIDSSWDTEHKGRNYLYANKDANANAATTANDCKTRFADVGANNRLFTVWVDYDGEKMNVRIANGDFKSAVRPEEAQIKDLAINLSDYFEAGKNVHLGFTSAVGTSKANHTIHAFQFTNRFDPIDGKANYKVEYYLQDEAGKDTYTLQEKDTLHEEEAEVEAVVNDTNYKKNYGGYEYTTVDGKSVSEIVVAADGTSVLKLYYNIKEEETAKYKLNYWQKDKATGEYKKVAESDVKTGSVGAEVSASDVDKNYPSKYANEHYALSVTHAQEDSKVLQIKNETYEMNVFYDPEVATYRLHYWLYNPNTKRYEERTDDNHRLRKVS